MWQQMTKRARAAVVAGALAGSLVACGGSGDDSGNTRVSVYVTDAPGDVYAGVNVTLYDLRLCHDARCADTVSLFHSDAGLTLPLHELDGVLQYLNTVEIPAGSYNRLEAILDRDLTIADAGGGVHPAQFAPEVEQPNKPNTVTCEGDRCSIRFNGEINPLAHGKLAVDFVLKEFEVAEHACGNAADTTSWCVTEVRMHPLTPAEVENEDEYEVHGVVTLKNDAALMLDVQGVNLGVQLGAGTRCEANGTTVTGVAACLAQIPVGACVEVESSVDPASVGALVASEIEVEHASHCGRE